MSDQPSIDEILDGAFDAGDGDELPAISLGTLSEASGYSQFVLRGALRALPKEPPRLGHNFALTRAVAGEILEILFEDEVDADDALDDGESSDDTDDDPSDDEDDDENAEE